MSPSTSNQTDLANRLNQRSPIEPSPMTRPETAQISVVNPSRTDVPETSVVPEASDVPEQSVLPESENLLSQTEAPQTVPENMLETCVETSTELTSITLPEEQQSGNARGQDQTDGTPAQYPANRPSEPNQGTPVTGFLA